MTIPLVDLKAQYHTIKPEIDAAVARIFENASFILGEEVAAFEDAFARYCGTRHAIGVSSGTDALQLALLACGIGAGDQVITTPYTFIATVAAIVHVGATPVLADIDPRTYNISPKAIEAAITPRTRAILPVHLYGQPAEMGPILDLARAYNLRVIEDACQAIGAAYQRDASSPSFKAGNLGDIGCFSFYPSKNLGAAGDGGMITTNDDSLAEHIRRLRDHGRTSHYGHCLLGYTYRLDALQAAVLHVKLAYIDAWNEARRRHAAAYNELLANTEVITPYEAEGCHSVYHIYAIRTPKRDAVYEHLRACGIGAGIHYPLPVHLQEACAGMGGKKGSYPVSEQVAEEELSLPIYPEMTAAQRETVVEAIKEALA